MPQKLEVIGHPSAVTNALLSVIRNALADVAPEQIHRSTRGSQLIEFEMTSFMTGRQLRALSLRLMLLPIICAPQCAYADTPPQRVASPEILDAVSGLLRAASHQESTSLVSPELVHSVSEILSAVCWPLSFALAIILFRKEIKDLINRIRKIGIGSTSVEAEEIQKKVESSAAAVLASDAKEPPASISNEDVRRSAEVGALSESIDPAVIRRQIDQISAEYEGVRANMPPSRERTKQMGAVMAKMRTLGRAVYPYRQELVNSPSPGKRLFAIASLQMVPDYNQLDWLASRVSEEAPYVQYQALTALQSALRNAGPNMKPTLSAAIEKAIGALNSADPDPSRWNLARVIKEELDRIP